MASEDKRYQYTFTNKETRVNRIAQSWKEYYELQSSRDWFVIDYDKRLSRINNRATSEQNRFHYQWEQDINQYYGPLQRFTRVGKITVGICQSSIFNSLRLYLKTLRNHAALMGDKELYQLCYNLDRDYWTNGKVEHYLLPAPKQ